MGYKNLLTVEKFRNSLVIDNSVIMRWFFEDGSEKDRNYAKLVLNYMKENSVNPIVPTLWVSEACFVSSKYVKNGNFSFEIVQEKLKNAFAMVSVVDPRIEPVKLFEYANRLNVSDYDANYALLAENLNCPIATLDKKLGKAVLLTNGDWLASE